MGERNAIITDATIEISEDFGCLVGYLELDFGDNSQQKFGSFAIKKSAGVFIQRVLEVAGTSYWSGVTGKSIRTCGTNERIEAIGHIVKDIWFEPAREFSEAQKEGEE